MANKDLFKQAIAEAKSVREAAIANAKEALEETLTPHLKDMLAAKLQEMEDSQNEEEVVNEVEEEVEETVEENMSGFNSVEEAEAEEEEVEDDSEESEDEAGEEAGEEEGEEGEMEVEDDQELGDLSVEDFKILSATSSLKKWVLAKQNQKWELIWTLVLSKNLLLTT